MITGIFGAFEREHFEVNKLRSTWSTLSSYLALLTPLYLKIDRVWGNQIPAYLRCKTNADDFILSFGKGLWLTSVRMKRVAYTIYTMVHVGIGQWTYLTFLPPPPKNGYSLTLKFHNLFSQFYSSPTEFHLTQPYSTRWTLTRTNCLSNVESSLSTPPSTDG